ncbi:DUF4855 domain-containing protein [Paenibacillus sp. 32O-W]|uniref:DUF4855 domain-containing protein n=1 Tax=Paenibacillus sp. 32O-W TaxID=1695218 RepID=UPI0011A9A68A|nr:DUF4855 domain-containing protein [Paenibacillus sp. 32O-W]
MSAKRRISIVMVLCMVLSWFTGVFPTERAQAAVDFDMTVNESTYTNLALNRSVTILEPDIHFDVINNEPLKYEKESDKGDTAKLALLTDGKLGNLSDWSNVTDWFVFYRKMKREVIIDLGDIQTVKEMSISFGQRSDVGIAPPFNVRYYVSNDGEQYHYVGVAEPDVPLFYAYNPGSTQMDRKLYKLSSLPDGSELTVQARYVKLVFVIDTFGWADEIEIRGVEGMAEDAVLPETLNFPDGFTYDELVKPGVPEGAEVAHQFLWYTGPMNEANKHFTDWTREKVMTMLGHRDIEGRYTDWYFDDILAIPVVAMVTPTTPTGTGAAIYKTKGDMLAFVDFIFQQETQLGAINWAVGELNKQLGTDKKVRINMAIPYLDDQNKSNDFGDIGYGAPFYTYAGDFASAVREKGMDPQSQEGSYEMARLAVENKKAIVRWYIDEVISRFKAAGYDHLELNSFYWYHERVLAKDGEVEMIRAAADHLHEKGYYFTWIPYIGPASPYIWRDLGFDTASIQPSYAFRNSSKQIFPATEELARRVGGSIEVEYDDYRTLAQYLNYGYFSGYMTEAANTYYLSSNPIVVGAFAYAPRDNKETDSLSVIRRNVYDRVFEYVKGTYQPRFTATLVTNVTDKANIGVNVKLPLADNFVKGNFTIMYDVGKAAYDTYDLGPALKGKADVVVDHSTPGEVKVSFDIHNPDDALAGDLAGKQKILEGAPDLLTLKFHKNDGVNDTDITPRLFVLSADGQMITRDNIVYLNWGASDLIPGSLEEKIAGASDAVVKALRDRDYYDIARELVEALPDSLQKAEFQAKLDSIDVNPFRIEWQSPADEFRLGNDAKMTVQATNLTTSSKQMTLIMGLFDTTSGEMVAYTAVTQEVEAAKSITPTAMIKIPASGTYEVRAFVWDSLDGMRPLSNRVTVPVR